jgi:ATP-dependent Zn protease
VSHYPAQDAYQGMPTRALLINNLKVAVAGKAAEVEFCGLKNQTLGVGGDFAHIRSKLHWMARSGMLGPLGAAMGIMRDPLTGGVGYNDTPEMRTAMDEMFARVLMETREALRERGDVVRELVALLLQKEELLSEEVEAFFNKHNLPTPRPTIIRDGEEVALLPKPDAQPA